MGDAAGEPCRRGLLVRVEEFAEDGAVENASMGATGGIADEQKITLPGVSWPPCKKASLFGLAEEEREDAGSAGDEKQECAHPDHLPLPQEEDGPERCGKDDEVKEDPGAELFAVNKGEDRYEAGTHGESETDCNHLAPDKKE